MDKRTARDILSRNAWFANLPDELARDIMRLGRIRQVADVRLFAVGDEPNGLFAVLDGNVRISFTSRDGRLALLLVATPGQWFGETSLFDRGRRYSEAFADGSATVLQLGMSAFRELTGRSSSNYAAFVQLLCEHHRTAMDHIASIGALPMRSRVAQRLLSFAQGRGQGDDARPVIALSQDELAASVGISRQAINVHLKRLEREGCISLGYASTKLLDRTQLERIAKGLPNKRGRKGAR